MKHARLDLARSAELLPALDGTTAVFGQIENDRLRGLDATALRCISDAFTLSTMLKSAGISVTRKLEEPVSNALVFVPRTKAETWDLISAAVKAAPEGWVIVDGQKTDGIESVAKQIARDVAEVGSYSKGHGKTIWFRASEAVSLIKPVTKAQKNKGGYLTAPGVFSADDVDPASELLMQYIPADVGTKVADLGAGWGYLTARLLEQNEHIKALHLIEDNASALDCARSNIADDRADFQWADALSWTPSKPLDTVVMNPPFHTSRSAEPKLGIDFIHAAARMLRSGGKLFMVANAHLPYEAALEQSFDRVELLGRTSRFKVFSATRGRIKLG